MMNNRGRQFTRGGGNVGGMMPPRRRRMRGGPIRARTPSGQYRGTSFSDDRNDSSPPPQNSGPINHNRADNESSYGGPPHAPRFYPRGGHRMHPRGPRQHHSYAPRNHQDRPYYDHHHRQQQHHQHSHNSDNRQARNYDASDNEYNENQADDHQQPSHRDSSQNNITEAVQNHSEHLMKNELFELKDLFSKMSTELDQVKTRLSELESNGPKGHRAATGSASIAQQTTKDGADVPNEIGERELAKKKLKALKYREKKAAKSALKRANFNNPEHVPVDQQQQSSTDQAQPGTNTGDNSVSGNIHQDGDAIADPTQQTSASSYKLNRRFNHRDRNNERRRPPKHEFKERAPKPMKPVPNEINDDSTTHAADPSSEDRPEGDDNRDGALKERVRVMRKKKIHVNRRGAYAKRNRFDSSERQSNDTSPHNEANGNEDYKDRRKRNTRRSYPELSENEINSVVMGLKREFVNSERPIKAIKGTVNEKGPKVAYELAREILDHAIQDVTSPSKLGEIANNLYQLIVSEDNMSEVDFQRGFYEALTDLSKRENDVAIDAPRYMDTLGQIMAECLAAMNVRQRNLIRKFLNKSVDAYAQPNRALLLASIMKSLASLKDERFAKDVWDFANMNWSKVLPSTSEVQEFLETHEVLFTTKTFSPIPPKEKRTAKEFEKFADDVTHLVEEKSDPKDIQELVEETNILDNEQVVAYGTLIYAIVRACIESESDEYKFDNEALNKYSTFLKAKDNMDQDGIALHALVALTKLWHQHNCPQDLLGNILLALYNQKTASKEALSTWLNSDSLISIPGIGAARLTTKRCIEHLIAQG